MHAYLSTHYQSRPGLAYLSPQTLSIYDEIFQRSSFYEICRQGLLSLISLHPAGLHSFLFFSGYSEMSRSQVFSTHPHAAGVFRVRTPKTSRILTNWPIIFVVTWSQDSLGLHSRSRHHLSPSMVLTWIIEQPQDVSKFFLWCIQDAGIRKAQFSDFSSAFCLVFLKWPQMH